MRKMSRLQYGMAFAGAMVLAATLAFAQPTIVNPSFEEDDFTDWPGYRDSITGWTISGAGFGLNGNDFSEDDPNGPFHGDRPVPDGDKVLFIQRSDDQDEHVLYQDIDGFSEGWHDLSFYVNARPDQSFDMSVELGGMELIPTTRINAMDEYMQMEVRFRVPTAGEHRLEFIGTNPGGDNTILYDHIVLEPLDPDVSYSGDGLTLAEKEALGLDPFSPDSNGDGVPDWWYLQYYSEVEATQPGFSSTVLDEESGFTVRLAFQYGFDPFNLPDDLPMIPAAELWALLALLVGLSLGGAYLMLRTRRCTAM